MPGIMTQIPAAPVVWPVVGVEVVVVLVFARRQVGLTVARAAAVVAIGLYTAAALSVTLFPMQIETGVYANRAPWISKVNLIPFVTIDVRTFVPNIVLTVPLGAALWLLRRDATWRAAAVAGFLASLAVELVQFVTDVYLSSGRTADVNDVIANTVGALIGFGIVSGLCRLGSARALAGRYALWTDRDRRAVAVAE